MADLQTAVPRLCNTAVTVDNALEFRSVSVEYPAPHKRISSLKEWGVRLVTARIGETELYTALRDVSFAIPHGQSLGIIGSNGAGKSTLLRVAAGILPPSRGEALISGNVAPIIELGTGFDYELTGRENIWFNGALLGRARKDIKERLDEIISFAELGPFIEAPLRTYSTGMVARLAFSVATSVDADVLLLDEILSVGDMAFREKSRKRMDALCKSGATVVLVSHDPKSIRELCHSTLWLVKGEIRELGETDRVLEHYQAFCSGSS